MKKILIGVLVFCSPILFASPHPLDDLSESEIKKTVQVIKESGRFADDLRFPTMMTAEPKKSELLARVAGVPRRAFATIFEKSKNRFYEVVIDLEKGQIESAKEISKVQPPVLMEEYERVDRLVRADLRWQESMKKRGISNFDDVYVDSWAPGRLSETEIKSGLRLLRALTYYKAKGPIYYTRSVEGVVASVDLNHDRVIEVRDTGVVPIAAGAHDFSEKVETRVSPIQQKQKKGSSFKVTGQEIEWENWRFRYSFQQMKGLVLFDVRYVENGRVRPVLYKAGLSEMVVPYGDSDINWAFRSAFDVGEYGLARSAHSLELGVDLPENGKLMDAVFSDDVGGIIKIPAAIGIYERDSGLLWKHMDQNTRKADSMRATDLVMMFTTTIGNYDYGISWVFRQDGSIEVEAHLTGIMLAKGSTLIKNPCDKQCFHLVEKNIIAPMHQHFFAFRLDFDIDGQKNSAIEVDTKSIPLGKLNPYGNAFEAAPHLIRSEKEGGRDINFFASRKWKVVSSNTKNSLGHPTGFVLIPGENAVSFLDKTSPIRRRAGFLEHPVWFTRYHDEEQGAAGEYPNQHAGGDGIKKWASNGESLENEDNVMWYVMGITHIPRPEDWPVMPTYKAGFKLLPVNFFNHNPSLDIKN